MAMLYRNSLARLYGAPGSGKSFVAMDMALSLAAGKFYLGRRLEPRPVVYVMAEGQAVNAERADAWMSKHGVSVEDVEDTFFAVPDAIQLTEAGVKSFVEVIAPVQPALVVLDTKNAMMVGEENSASDFAVMRRALDMIRKTSECCVMLVDHTGYEGTRARGSSAATAGMDTEIRIDNDGGKPALVTAEVTRDKAAESGSMWAWHLMPQHPAAVLVPVEGGIPTRTNDPDKPEWREATDEHDLPRWITDKTPSAGKIYLVELARYLKFETSKTGDPDRQGRNLAQAIAAVKPATADKKTAESWRAGVGRAWSQLKSRGCLEYWDINGGTVLQERSGFHVWKDDDDQH
ncbi:MAG TPA: AAA family ATPase [Mycobacterium sp.]|jgi:hypothetical protein|nr:AAA family ATPase [Mycobacterium sp.]